MLIPLIAYIFQSPIAKPGNSCIVRADCRPGELRRDPDIRGDIHRGVALGQDGIEDVSICAMSRGEAFRPVHLGLENGGETLSRFLDDGTLPLDNNRCERAMRPAVMGLSNWLFTGSLVAGTRAVQIMSLLETAKMNGLKPHVWLTEVLKRLPEWPEERLSELLTLERFTFSG